MIYLSEKQRKNKRIILEEIKPVDCQVCFFHDVSHLPFSGYPMRSSYYDEINKIAFVYTAEATNRHILYSLLHEVCHHITWDKRWDRRKFRRDEWGEWRPSHPTYYLREYKAEKLLRKICRRYGWHELLQESDMLLTKHLLNKTKDTERQYTYSCKRIVREEKRDIAQMVRAFG